MNRKNCTLISTSEAQTINAAKDFAQHLRNGDVVLLHGDLGMGKSVFSRAVIRALSGHDEMEVPSPTFTLVQEYALETFSVWHFDLYRLTDISEIYEIGWEDACSDGILLVEWPERLGHMTPKEHIEIKISVVSDMEDSREIEVRYVTKN